MLQMELINVLKMEKVLSCTPMAIIRGANWSRIVLIRYKICCRRSGLMLEEVVGGD